MEAILHPLVQDEKGNPIRPKERYTYDIFDSIASHTDPKGHITWFVHNSDRDHLGTIYPDGTCERFDYNKEITLVKKKTKINKPFFPIDYDPSSQAHKKKREINDQASFFECVKCDSLQRVVESWIEEPDTSITHKQSIEYDCFGNISKITKGTHLVAIDYLQGTRPVCITTAQGSTQTEYREYSYNRGSYVLEKVIKDPKGIVTSLFYDALARLVLMTKSDSSGVLVTKKEFLYDAVGNLAAVIEEPNKIRTELIYDPMNKLVGFQEACGTRESLFLPYQPKSNDLNEEDPSVSEDGILTVRTYTREGKIASEEITDEYGSYAVRYIYDKLGRVKHILLPDHSFIDYVYEGTVLKTIRRRSETSTKLYCHENKKHNSYGQVLCQALSDQKTEQAFTYTQEGLLASKKSPYFSEHVIAYDPVFNPLQVERQGKIYNFAYDAKNALTEEPELGIYSYDEHENATDGTYNALHQLLAKGDTNYRYDLQGNLIEAISPVSRKKLTYTDNNQLSSYKKNENDYVGYKYDVFHRCQQRQEKNKTKRFFYIGATEIGALDKEGKIIELKVPESVGNERAFGAVAIELNGKQYLPISDLFGNIVSLIDPYTNQVVESYEYTAFGQKEEQLSRPFINPYRYKSLRVDPTTSYVSFAYRYYDPSTKRFLTRDPAGYIDGMNLYAYVHNNPLRYMDDLGLKARYGACTCHSDCQYYVGGVCGHGAGIYLGGDNTLDPNEVPYRKPPQKTEDVLTSERLGTHALLGEAIVFEVGRYKLQSGSIITAINGQFNTFSQAKNQMEEFSKLGRNVKIRCIYNPTSGSLLNDTFSSMGILRFGREMHAQKVLVQQWTEFFDENPDKGTIYHYSWSQGSAITKRALQELKAKFQQRVVPISFMPADFMSKKDCKEPFHYISSHDPIPYAGVVLDFLCGLFHTFDSDLMPTPGLDSYLGAKESGNVYKLPRAPGAPLFDHDISSLTYRDTITRHFDKIITTEGLDQ